MDRYEQREGRLKVAPWRGCTRLEAIHQSRRVLSGVGCSAGKDEGSLWYRLKGRPQTRKEVLHGFYAWYQARVASTTGGVGQPDRPPPPPPQQVAPSSLAQTLWLIARRQPQSIAATKDVSRLAGEE